MPLGWRSLSSCANAMKFMLCPPFKLAASNTDFVQLPEATRARLEQDFLHINFSLVDRAKRPRDGPERENGIP